MGSLCAAAVHAPRLSSRPVACLSCPPARFPPVDVLPICSSEASKQAACSGGVCITGARTLRGRLSFAAPCAALTARVCPCGSLLVRGACATSTRRAGPLLCIFCCCFRPACPRRVAGLLSPATLPPSRSVVDLLDPLRPLPLYERRRTRQARKGLDGTSTARGTAGKAAAGQTAHVARNLRIA